MMENTGNQRGGSDIEEQDPPPRMLLSKMLQQDLVRNGVLDFLDRDSVLSFMKVEEFSKVFRLRRCFCEGHGTKLGAVWGAPGHYRKDCQDCEMEAIAQFRCQKCDEFSKWNEFYNCDACSRSECHGCTDTAKCSLPSCPGCNFFSGVKCAIRRPAVIA
jgi:hypothetical protein